MVLYAVGAGRGDPWRLDLQRQEMVSHRMWHHKVVTSNFVVLRPPTPSDSNTWQNPPPHSPLHTRQQMITKWIYKTDFLFSIKPTVTTRRLMTSHVHTHKWISHTHTVNPHQRLTNMHSLTNNHQGELKPPLDRFAVHLVGKVCKSHVCFEGFWLLWIRTRGATFLSVQQDNMRNQVQIRFWNTTLIWSWLNHFGANNCRSWLNRSRIFRPTAFRSGLMKSKTLIQESQNYKLQKNPNLNITDPE